MRLNINPEITAAKIKIHEMDHEIQKKLL